MKKPIMKIAKAPYVRPMINVGCLMDIPNGSYVKGIHNENILNGGLGCYDGFVGRGNRGKSSIAHYCNIVACYRMGEDCSVYTYDTEQNIVQERLLNLINNYTPEDGRVWDQENRWVISDASVTFGDEWFDSMKEFMKSKRSDKEYLVNTPFWDRNAGKKGLDPKGNRIPFCFPIPTFGLIDSLTRFEIAGLVEKKDKVTLGDSKQNTFNITSGGIKTRLINEIQFLCPASSTYIASTGHIGDKIQVEMFANNVKDLNGLKKDEKINGVPKNYTYLTYNCWYLTNSSPLVNDSSNKFTMYPRKDEPDVSNSKDLNLIQSMLIRSKSGPSDGNIIHIVFSQNDGVLASLTEFHHLKTNQYYGLIGSKQSFANILCPEISLNRKTVRHKLDESPKLRRAMNILSELLQMTNLWIGKIDPELICDPQTLYEDIRKLGYDWNMILEYTRGWWTVDGVHEDSLFLSTMDILEMRLGRYHPYWLEADKKTIKKQYASKLKK